MSMKTKQKLLDRKLEITSSSNLEVQFIFSVLKWRSFQRSYGKVTCILLDLIIVKVLNFPRKFWGIDNPVSLFFVPGN